MVPTDKDAYDSFSAHRDVPAYYEGFHALPYSLENTFPVVKLGVQDKWTPTSDEQAPASDSAGAAASVLRVVSSGAVLVRFQWLQICLGWILGTLFVGGVTGLVRND
jgi:hypothetical protein